MPSKLGLDIAELVSALLECALFGMSAVAYFMALLVISSHGRTNNAVVVTVVCSTLFLLAGAYIALGIYRLLEAFIDHPVGAEDYFLTLNNPTYVAKMAIYHTQTIVGNSFGIWRVYIVWKQQFEVIIMPLVLTFANIAAACVIPYKMVIASPGDYVLTQDLHAWVTGAVFLTCVQTVINTLLIGHKIWRGGRNLAPFISVSPSLILPMLEVIVESAVLYTAGAIVVLATYFAGSNAHYIVMDAMPPLICIAFMAIIIWGTRAVNRVQSPEMPLVGDGYRQPPVTSGVAIAIKIDQTSHDDRGLCLQPLRRSESEGDNSTLQPQTASKDTIASGMFTMLEDRHGRDSIISYMSDIHAV